jgi:hypothetical protein
MLLLLQASGGTASAADERRLDEEEGGRLRIPNENSLPVNYCHSNHVVIVSRTSRNEHEEPCEKVVKLRLQ